MDGKTRLAAGAVAGAGAALAATKAALDRRDGHEDDSSPSRVYRLKRKETPTAGVRRIAAGRADDAIKQLRERSGEGFASAVHESRKDLKKLRSVLRLVRHDLGDDVYRRENTRFRDTGRLLAGPRDAEVKLETLSSLRERFDDRLSWDGLARFANTLAKERDQHASGNGASHDGAAASAVERAVAEIKAGQAAVADWPLHADDWELIGPGLERSYRRGRNRFADVRDEVGDEGVHEWRKRVKDLWYQLRIVRDSWKPVLQETADEVHELSDLLGDHHDLAVLRDDALDRRDLFADGELEKLLASISERQDELADEAISLGDRVYAEKPKVFARRLRSYWQSWR